VSTPPNVIVYDLPGAPANEYHVPDPWVAQYTLGPQRLDLAAALTAIAAQALPAAASNLAFTTEDQLPTLWQAQNRKAAGLAAACGAEIAAGYSSSALGAPHLYPMKPTDQANMDAGVIHSLFPGLPADWTTPHMCQDANGVWARRAHTAAEIQQAGADGKAFVIARLQKLDGLVAQAFSAASVAEIAAITW
jgi:hypothetical protein